MEIKWKKLDRPPHIGKTTYTPRPPFFESLDGRFLVFTLDTAAPDGGSYFVLKDRKAPRKEGFAPEDNITMGFPTAESAKEEARKRHNAAFRPVRAD